MKTITGKSAILNLLMPLALIVFLLSFTNIASAQVTITGPISVCAGAGPNAYTAVGGVAPYTWTVTSTGAIPIVVAGNTPVITVDWGSIPATGTINVVTGAGSASITVLIGVATPAISGIFNVCTSSVYSYSVASPVAGEDYDWVVTGGFPPVWSGTSGIVTWPGTPGTYNINLQASRPGEGTTVCYSDPVVQNVSVLAPPSSGIITGGQDEICSGSSAIFNAPAPPPGNTYYNFNWVVTGSSPNVVSFTGQGTSSITVTGGTVAGTASIIVTYSNVLNGACTATSATRNITIAPAPSPVITGSLLVCPGSGSSYTASGASGSSFSWSVSPVSGSWFGTIIGSSTGSAVTIEWTNTSDLAQTGTVTLIENNGSGCSGLVTSNVTIKPSPTVNPVSDQIYCNGLPAPAVPLTGTVAGTTFSWTNTNTAIGLPASGSGSTIPSFTATNLSALPVTALITITPVASGCTGQSVFYTITVYPTLVAGTAFSNQSICAQSTPAGLTATSPSGGNTPYTYQWEYSTDNSSFLPVTGATSSTYQPGVLSSDIWYRQAQTSAGNCGTVFTNAVKITVNPLPLPTITGSAAACVNTSGNIYTTEAGKTGYTWSVTGGAIVGPANTNAISVTWNTAGNQLITVNYTDGNGCTAIAPATKIVTVQSTVIPTITGPDPACTGNTSTYFTENGMLNYIWTVSAGGTIIGASNTSSIAVIWNATGSQSVSVKYNDLNGCSTSVPTVKNIVVNASPLPTITGTASICPNSSGIVYFTEAGMSDYTWTITSGGSITTGQGTNVIMVTWSTSGAQTITVNYKNSSGCSAATPTTKAITVLPTPQPVISGPVITCTNNTVYYNTEPGMTNYQWGISAGGSIIAGAGTNNISVIWNSPGAGNVSVSYINSSGCPTITPAVKNVTVNAAPIVTITGVDTVCLNGTTTYTTEPGMALYSWSVGAGGIITSGQGTNNISVKWTQAGSRSVNIGYINTSNCAGSAEMAVTVYAPPVPVITGPTFACTGGTGSDFVTNPGMTNYIWNVTSGGIITAGSGTSSVTVTWSIAGLQSVYVSYTDNHGCTSANPTQYSLSVNSRPVNPVITGPAVACDGTTNNAYTTLAGMGSYNWTVSPGGTIITSPSTSASTIMVAWNTPGAQSVGVNYTSIAGCEAITPATFPVLVNSKPEPSLSGPDTVCMNAAGNVYVTEPGMSNYTWIVSPGGIITAGGTSGSSNITITWTTSGAKTVQVNYANAHGCLAIAATVFNVMVNPLPVPFITGPTTTCPGLPGITYTTEQGMTGYNWTISGGGSITAGQGTSEITVIWAVAGVQSVTVTYTDLSGCSSAAPTVKTITVLPAPLPSLAGPAVVCNGSIEIYTTDPGMTGYLWTVSPGGTIISGDNTEEVTVNWTSPGPKTITVAYTNASGCITLVPTSMSVSVKTNVIATLTGPDPACSGHANTYSTESGMLAYIWTVSAGGTIIGASNTSSLNVIWNTPGNHSVSVIYTDPIGCTQATPTVKNIVVNASPVPTITGTSSICPGSSGIVYFTESGMTGYTWTVSSGGIITAGSGTNAITVTWVTPGTQSVTVNYLNSSGCNASTASSKIITVLPDPTPVITGPAIICNGNTAVYSTASGMTNYQWTISSGGTITSGSNTNVINVLWNAVGLHAISVDYINPSGCPTLIPTVKSVQVNPTPAPTITGADTTCLNGTIIFTTEVGQALYIWTVGAGGIITSGQGTSSIAVKWTQAGSRIVSVNYTNTSNCAATAQKTITVYAPPVPVISGPVSSCANTTGVEYTTSPGMTNYSWAITSGGIITAGNGTSSITVTWTTTGIQTVNVSYTDTHGCTAVTPSQFDVTVNSRPVPTITGTNVACAGSVNNTYTTQPGMISYTWSVSAGGTILTSPSDHANTITVAWNTPGQHMVSVNYINAAGCEAINPGSFACTVNAQPVPSLNGPASACLNSAGNVYATEGGMSNYTWTVSPGGTITAGGTTTSDNVTVTWTSAGIKTVMVNYANSAGCLAAAPSVYTVTVNPLPVPAISGPAEGCVNTTGNIYFTEPGMTGYTWNISTGGTISSGQGTATVTVTWTTAGTQSITVNYTDTKGCNAAVASVKTININVLPIPTITGGENGCLSFNSSFSTEPGMSGYTWLVSPGGTIVSGANLQTVIINWTVLGPQTVSVSYTNLNGCVALPAVFNVTVRDLVVPSITGPDPVCTEHPVIYSTQPGMTGYTWSVSTSGVIISGNGTDSITVIWYTSGTKTITVNYTNQYGCTAANAAVKNILVNTSPVPWINGVASVCQGTAGVIYSTAPGMTGYNWSISPGGTITGGMGTESITVTWTASGPQTVSVNYTDAGGCNSNTPVSKTVDVLPAPVPVINGPVSVCNGSTAVYTTDPGMGSYQWAISPGGTIVSGAGSNIVTVDWIATGPQFLTVTYLGSNGCNPLVPAMASIMVTPLPVPSITGDSTACINGTSTFTTQPGMTSYQWAVSSGGTIIAGAGTYSIVVSWTAVGPKTLTVNYMDLNGCFAAQLSSKTITVYQLPVPVITGLGTACIGTPGNIYVTEPGMSNYIWSVSAGGVITSGAGTNTITVTWNVIGPQVVSVNYTSAKGCTAATPTLFGVTVNSLPVPTINGTALTCAGSVTNTYNTEPGMISYTWSVSPGGIILTNPSTTASTVIVAWLTAGNHWVSVNYENAIGCMGATPAIQNVVVKTSPAPTITGVNNVCEGTPGVVYMTEAGNANYSWTISSGGIITAGSGTNMVTVNWTVAGTQTLTVNYTSLNGCSAATPTAKSVTVHPLPVPTISGSGTVCINGNTTHVTETGMTGYQWTVSAGGTIQSGSSSSSIVVQWTTPGSKSVTVNYTNANGCTAALPSTKTVTVYGLPVPIITGVNTVCAGATGVTYATEQGMTNYTWTVTPGGTITAGAGSSIITVTWNTPGIQSVSVSYANAYGCSPVNPTNLPVTVNAPPVPTITGNNQLCVNSGNYTYSTEPGMQNYLWTVSSGGIIVSGQGTSSIQINWSVAGIHPVSVGYTSAAGCIAVPTIMNVTVKSLPDAHGPIAGDTLICKPQNGVVYSIAPISNATGYVWNVPVFANIISGSNTNIITVDFGDATQSGNVSVFGTNSCGNGPFAPLLPVGVFPYPETPHVTVIEPDTLVSSAPSGNQWYREFIPIPGATGQTYIATNIGRYFVIANPNGCISDTSNVIYMFPVGMDDEVAMTVNVYPNPADDIVMLKINTAGREEILSVRLINSIGQETLLLSDLKLSGEVTRSLDLGNPPNGIYHLVMQFGKNNVIRKLIVINE